MILYYYFIISILSWFISRPVWCCNEQCDCVEAAVLIAVIATLCAHDGRVLGRCDGLCAWGHFRRGGRLFFLLYSFIYFIYLFYLFLFNLFIDFTFFVLFVIICVLFGSVVQFLGDSDIISHVWAIGIGWRLYHHTTVCSLPTRQILFVYVFIYSFLYI
jgi:hypothetical protein